MLSIVLCETIFKFSYMFFFKSLPLPLLTVRHIYEISEMTTLERRTIVTRPRSLMDFSLCSVRFYPGVNSRAELVTLAPGLRRWLGDNCILFVKNLATQMRNLVRVAMRC